MVFKKASSFYSGKERHFNEVWKHVVEKWNNWMSAAVEGELFHDGALYVEERLGGDTDPHDILAYVQSNERRPCVIRGPAGIGKTTFIHRARDTMLDSDRFTVGYVDGNATDLTTGKAALCAKISSDLQQVISESDPAPEWLEFWLRHAPSSTGNEVLLRLSQRDPDGPQTLLALDTRMTAINGENPVGWIRTQLAFIRLELGKIPVLIIDNIDHYKASVLKEVLDLARQLTLGDESRFTSGHHKVVAASGAARVLVAMRPITIACVRPKVSQEHVITVTAPHLGKVLTRRIDRFLDSVRDSVRDDTRRELHFVPEKIPAADTLARAKSKGLSGSSPAETLDGLTDWELCKRFLSVLNDLLLHGPSAPANVLYSATNRNVRASLLAACNFVRSGHLENSDFDNVLEGRRPPNKHRLFKALLLGIRGSYSESARETWVANLFNDGQPDADSVLTRPRLLKLLDVRGRENGASKCSVVQYMESVFGYSVERSERVWHGLEEFGLIDERTSDQYVVSEAGSYYLANFLGDFEYIQHVAVDVWVPKDDVIACQSHDEDASIRFRRVTKVCEWIRTHELESMKHVLSRQATQAYQAVFGTELICHTVAKALRNVAPDLPPNDRRETYERTAAGLVTRTEFTCMCEAAGWRE